MNYIYSIAFVLISLISYAQDCMEIDLDRIKSNYTESQLNFIDFSRAGFEIPDKDRISCIEISASRDKKQFVPTRYDQVRIPGMQVFNSKLEDGTLVNLIYYETGEKAFYYSTEELEVVLVSEPDRRGQYQLVINELESDFKCGNEEAGKEGFDSGSYEGPKNRPICFREYEVEVGAAADFEFLIRRAGGSATAANSIITSRFTGVASRYGDCDMGVIAVLIDMVIEPIDDLFFNTPHCLFNSDNSDAFKYNKRFADSPNRPSGDVITLWTGQELRGAFCIGDIGGMAYWTGHVCDRKKTNVCQGNQASKLWTHEIGHNLGVGIGHGNVPAGFFYGNGGSGDGPWHYTTVSDIHGNIDGKSCVDKVDYCCTDFDDVIICRDNPLETIQWCSKSKVDENCIGDLKVKTGNAQLNNSSICGVFLPGQTTTTVSWSQVSSLGCEFKSGTFNVRDCTSNKPTFPNTPPIFRQMCYNDPPVCFEPNCVSSWEVQPNPYLMVTTLKNKICIRVTDFENIGPTTLCVRPRYACGGLGPLRCWTILIVPCEGDDYDGGPRFIKNISENKALSGSGVTGEEQAELVLNIEMSEIVGDAINIYPNPASNILNISNLEKFSEVFIYNIDGELIEMKDATSNRMTIDISNFSSGLYVVSVRDKVSNIVQSERLIVH